MQKGTWKREGNVWWFYTERQRHKGIEVKCEHCGDSFPTVLTRPRRFCSVRCSNTASWPIEARRNTAVLNRRIPTISTRLGERWGQDERGQWWELRGGRPWTRATIRTCQCCGQEYPIRPSSKTVHCSIICRSATQSRTIIAKRGGQPGGRYVGTDGYIWVYWPEHPRANRAKVVREHRIVMETTLGRYLGPHEQVHHRNGIKTDNRPENLELWNRSQPTGARATEIKHCPSCTCPTPNAEGILQAT